MGAGMVPSYRSQLSQVVALQPVQGLPIGEVEPLSSVEKQAKADSARPASSWQRGQGAFSPARLIGRSCSNFSLQSGQ